MSKLTDTLVIKHKDALKLIERLKEDGKLSVRERGELDKHIDECEECANKIAEVLKNK